MTPLCSCSFSLFGVTTVFVSVYVVVVSVCSVVVVVRSGPLDQSVILGHLIDFVYRYQLLFFFILYVTLKKETIPTGRSQTYK